MVQGWLSKLALRIHGQWCGPGLFGPQEPIDEIDGACRDHDLCYDTHGWGSIGCDAYLVHELRVRLQHPETLTRRAKVAARFIVFVLCLRPRVRFKVRSIEMWS